MMAQILLAELGASPPGRGDGVTHKPGEKVYQRYMLLESRSQRQGTADDRRQLRLFADRMIAGLRRKKLDELSSLPNIAVLTIPELGCESDCRRFVVRLAGGGVRILILANLPARLGEEMLWARGIEFHADGAVRELAEHEALGSVRLLDCPQPC